MQRTLPAGFIAPCLPTKTDKLPFGGQWLHEIKHDGFRIIGRKDDQRVRLYSRPGNDLTDRFPLIVETLARLRSRSIGRLRQVHARVRGRGTGKVMEAPSAPSAAASIGRPSPVLSRPSTEPRSGPTEIT